MPAELQKTALIYTGKAKSLYQTTNPQQLIMEFRDDTSAFDGIKVERLSRKGKVNNHINAFIMETLMQADVPTQFVRLYSETESVVQHLSMIPVECVHRNIAAGHLCSRLGIIEGKTLTPPTFELFLKNDALHDPMINESLAQTFAWANADELSEMKRLTFRVNEVLQPLFLMVDLLLVDFKLEFGRYQGKIVLGDEFTPDGCRIWDIHTRRQLDKDRFRKDLGDVIEAYEEVAHRLGVTIEE